MSDTGLTVPHMMNLSRRYAVTITVDRDGGHLPDLTRLVLGDPTAAEHLHVLADRAPLSHDELQSQIRRPFDEFAQRCQAC